MHMESYEQKQYRDVLRAVEVRMEAGNHGDARTLYTEYAAVDPARAELIRQHVQDGWGMSL